MKYIEIYSMIHSDSKTFPKTDNVNNTERISKPVESESIIKADCIKTDSSSKAV